MSEETAKRIRAPSVFCKWKCAADRRFSFLATLCDIGERIQIYGQTRRQQPEIYTATQTNYFSSILFADTRRKWDALKAVQCLPLMYSVSAQLPFRILLSTARQCLLRTNMCLRCYCFMETASLKPRQLFLKVKLTLQPTTKAQSGSGSIVLLFI